MLVLRPPAPGKKRRSYSTLGCPMSRGQVWCRGLCEPQNGLGACGRLAPHAMMSRYQLAILATGTYGVQSRQP